MLASKPSTHYPVDFDPEWDATGPRVLVERLYGNGLGGNNKDFPSDARSVQVTQEDQESLTAHIVYADRDGQDLYYRKETVSLNGEGLTPIESSQIGPFYTYAVDCPYKYSNHEGKIFSLIGAVAFDMSDQNPDQMFVAFTESHDYEDYGIRPGIRFAFSANGGSDWTLSTDIMGDEPMIVRYAIIQNPPDGQGVKFIHIGRPNIAVLDYPPECPLPRVAISFVGHWFPSDLSLLRSHHHRTFIVIGNPVETEVGWAYQFCPDGSINGTKGYFHLDNACVDREIGLWNYYSGPLINVDDSLKYMPVPGLDVGVIGDDYYVFQSYTRRQIEGSDFDHAYLLPCYVPSGTDQYFVRPLFNAETPLQSMAVPLVGGNGLDWYFPKVVVDSLGGVIDVHVVAYADHDGSDRIQYQYGHFTAGPQGLNAAYLWDADPITLEPIHPSVDCWTPQIALADDGLEKTVLISYSETIGADAESKSYPCYAAIPQDFYTFGEGEISYNQGGFTDNPWWWTSPLDNLCYGRDPEIASVQGPSNLPAGGLSIFFMHEGGIDPCDHTSHCYLEYIWDD